MTEFEQYIRIAVAALPERIKTALENVEFIVEEEVRALHASEAGIRMHEILLGLYKGIPKIKRGSGYFGVLPDKITIFQKPIEELAGHNERKIKELVREVVWHEIGHHLGFDEKAIRAVERKRSARKQ